MRRAEREVTDLNEILGIIDKCKVCHLAMIEDGWPYLLTMNFGYVYENGQLLIYLHSAKDGKKLELLKQNDRVAFEVDCDHEIVPAKYACAYNFRYASVMGRGHCEIVEDVDEKIKGLELLMKHQTGQDFVMEPKHTLAVAVLKITVDSFTGKRRIKK